MAKEIELTQGRIAIVDNEDFEWLNQWEWSFSGHKKRKHGYAVRRIYPNGRYNKATVILMHRLIMNCQKGKQVDHIDGNTTNNQRSNLRLSTQGQNCWNSRHRGGTSKFKGVCWYKNNKKWGALISINRKKIFLGLFNKETDAAKAYDEFAKNHHGEFARLNFP